MNTKINLENLENVAGGYEFSDEELRKLYDEIKKHPERPQYETFEGFKKSQAMMREYQRDILKQNLYPDNDNDGLLLKAPDTIF